MTGVVFKEVVSMNALSATEELMVFLLSIALTVAAVSAVAAI